jgi:hypothetical protein
MYIRKLINGKKISIYVVKHECRNYECFVISCTNTPGKYYCRINEVQGCPEIKKIKNK